jgi:dTMP kinase
MMYLELTIAGTATRLAGMEDVSLRLRRGAVVVFEGLDRSGKSTQLARLSLILEPGSAALVHMPSGLTSFSSGVYSLLENDRPRSGLAQQLAHLACHAENHDDLVKAAEAGALVLDRWWWSTVAYGWYGGALAQTGLSEATFFDLIAAVWRPISASVVFVFLDPHEADDHNSGTVESGYRQLLGQHPDVAVAIPDLGVDEVHDFIVSELVARELAVRG